MSFDEVKSAIAKEYNPKTSSEKTHATNLLKKWVTSVEYKDNELVQELSNAKTT